MTTAAPLVVTLGEHVRLVFKGWPDGHPKGDFPLELSWNSRTYRIPVGASVIVPFELAKLYFGDPRSGDTAVSLKDEYGQQQHLLPRHAEVKRLYDLWLPSEFGGQGVQFREFVPGDRTHFKDGVISDMIPLVEVLSMDGVTIPMVVHDPYGDSPVALTMTNESDTLRGQVRDQSEMIEALKQQLQETREALGLGMVSAKKKPGRPPKPKPGGLEAPDGVVEENPRMVLNPRTNQISPRSSRLPDSDPTSVDALPQDTD